MTNYNQCARLTEYLVCSIILCENILKYVKSIITITVKKGLQNMKKIIFRRMAEIAMIFVFLANVIFLFYVSYRYVQTHFLWNTTINGISCSFLTTDEAIEKIYEEENIEFSFIDGKTYTASLQELGIQAERTKIKQILQQNHSKLQDQYEYNLNSYVIVDKECMLDYFKQIPNLQKEKMVQPQNAYIVWNESEFLIQEEILGNLIDLDDALNLIDEKIKNGEKVIDFSSITTVKPDIIAEDLINECSRLNSILNSSINYELSNGSIVTLDSNIIKNWIYIDDNGNFQFDIENGALQFVEDLAIKVDNTNSSMYFNATDFTGNVIINVPENLQAQLDKENEFLNIKKLLGNSEPSYCKPIYDRTCLSDMLTSYIELDISRQHIWFYLNGELLFDTPCVTGNPLYGYDTPQGVFFLLNKDRNALLEGTNADGSKYSTSVAYWMRFYNGCGFHDAWWRANFGKEIYKTNGSHGCVNMPTEMAAKMFEVIDNTMPIIIYQSNM